ncbi:putative Ig domain-containing protein [Permianibacter aggregans]|uniref:putative Ig domain-containing protein n=1 Tax=Permianibacter aggregans TaxID=1510150 RepID=UPI0013C37191|nr:putative Ig domain-containing protein [Permianibacter aggregans]
MPNTFVYQARALNEVDEKVTFSLEEGPSALSITEEGYLSWTVTPADIGQHSVTIKATDVQGAFDTQSFLIYVLAPINQPPKFSSLPSQLVLQPGNVWQYPATAIDPENEPLVFSIDEAPEGFQVNAQTGFFYWLPVPEQAGQHRIIIRVQDPHGEMDTQQFSLAVNLGEEFWPPVIVSKPVQQTFVGATYRYPVIATDPDSPNLAFELLESVPGMSISQDSGEVLWTVPTDQLTGTIRITIKVSDERGQSDQQQYLLQVFRPNRAPSFVSLPPHVVTEQTRFRYDAKAVDPDVGDVLQYGFSLLNTNASINPETGVFHWQPDNRLAETVSLAHEYCMSDAPAEGVLDPVQKWRWQGVDGNSANADVFGPPMIAQLTDDNGDQVIDQRDTPDLVFIERRTNWLTAIDGATGKQHWVSKTIKLNGLGSVAVADIDGDGKVEIVATNESRNALHAFDHQGVLKWTAATGPTKTSPRDGISIADLDGDGQPEILHGARVFSHQGQLLWSGHQDSGGLESYGVLSIAADIDLDGKQEVIAGRTVYRHDGQVWWHRGDISAGSGMNAVGNFDQDDEAEIVLVASGQVYLLDSNGTTIWGPVAIPGGGIGGPPTVADFDGDGEPEIGVAGYSRYVVFETDGSIKWTAPVEDYSSNRTGSSVFDFEGDGRAEVLYADEKFFRVYDGETGLVRYQLANTSGTTLEYPLVVDIDNDNQAEIVLPSNESNTRGIRVLESASGSWVPTRDLWNQHAYAITNINDDGSIPRVPERSWLRHNTFRLNAFLDRPARALADLHVGNLQLLKAGQYYQVEATVRNRGTKPSSASTVVFRMDEGLPAVLEVSSAPIPGLNAGESIQVKSRLLTAQELKAYVMVQVDEAQLVAECAENNNTAGAALFHIHATDPGQLSDQQVFLVRVMQDNRAPAFVSTPPLQAQALTHYRYKPEVHDDNAGDSLVFTLKQAPNGMRINRETGELRWTPTNADVGQHEVELEAKDLTGATALQRFSMMVSSYVGPNREPVILSAPLTEARVNTAYEYQLQAWDEDGDALTYVFGVVPAGMTITDSGKIQWIPSLPQLGDNAVAVAVGDSKGGVAVQTFVVNVSGDLTNRAPVISPASYRAARVNEAWQYQVQAADPDGDALYFSLSQAPSGMFIDNSGLLQWTPSSSAVGDHSIVLRVTDGKGGQATTSFVLPVSQTVNLGNQPPAITSTPSQLIDQGNSYQYQLMATDSDGDLLSYQLLQAPEGMHIDANGLIQWTPQVGQIGEVMVRVQVTDGRGGIVTQTFNIVVRDPQAANNAPVIHSAPKTSVKIGQSYQYVVSASDPDGDNLVYSLGNVPAGMSINEATGVITWTPQNNQVGIHRIVVNVADGKGGQTEQRFDLYATAVAAANRRRCR